ncbi:hypothetical protein Sjap_008299 [Stephania japonica]|uniref:Uncharacterized protein n=1 Tax=Stephania japonica TaxID=461633 RepID=A0AAP0JQ26_9MAGN
MAQSLMTQVEFGFGEERELEYSYSDEEEFVSEEEIDVVLFLYGDARRIDPIFFEEDFENFDEEPKFDTDGYDFVEDKLVFGEDSLVIEVVSLFEVSQELEEVVRNVDVNNDSLGLIAKAKVLKFATNDGICIDGYLHDFSSKNNVLFYLFKHVETSCDDFIVKAEKTCEGMKIRRRIFINKGRMMKMETIDVMDNAYNDEDCRSEECIDLIESNNGNIFDINKPPFFDDNDDAIVEEKVVFGYDGRVHEVTLLTSKSQVSVVVSCDEASSTKIRGCRDEVDNYLVEKVVETKVQFAAIKHFCSVTDDMDEELVGTLFKTLMIVMVNQQGPSDDSGTSSTQAVSIEEFQTLAHRVAAQERQLVEILAILRASVVVASVPSTARVTVTQKEYTPGVTTMTLLPTTTTMGPVMAVIPRASTKIAPATLTVYGTTTTIKARQW